MGRYCILCLLTVFFVLTVIASAAAEKSARIRVGYCDYTGFIEQNANGIYVGYGCEYLDEMAKYTGWEYEYIFGSWEECLARLENGDIDLLPMAESSQERLRRYEVSQYSMGTEYAVLFVLPTNKKVFYEDFAAFSGIKVGMIRGIHQNILFSDYAKQHSFVPEAHYFASNVEMQAALYDGRIDAILTGSMDEKSDEKIIAQFAPQSVHIMARKGDREVMDSAEQAMRKIEEEKPYFELYLYEKYYGNADGANQLKLKREDVEFAQRCPVIRIVCDPNFSPISCYNDDTKQYTGAYVDILRLLLDRLSLAYEFVPVESSQEGLEKIKTGDADILLRVCRDPELEKIYNLNFTDPYIYEKNVIMGKKGISFYESAQLTIAVLDKNLGLQYFIKENYPSWSIKTYDTVEQCLSAIQEGEADISMQGVDWAMNYFQPDDYPQIGTITALDIDVPIRLGVSKDISPHLAQILNKSIQALSKQDQSECVIKNTFGNAYRVSTWEFIKKKRMNIALSFCVAGLLLTLIIFWVKRRKERELRLIAYTDRLTGLRNFEKFEIDAGEVLRTQNPAEYAVLYIDIEKFKYINESLGAERGDAVLIYFAKLFSHQMNGVEMFARVSGDRFVALLKCAEREVLEERLQSFYKIFSYIKNTMLENHRLVLVSGIYQLEPEDTDIALAVDRANLARKTVKGAHHSTLVFYDQKIHSRIIKEKEIESIMEKALSRGEFIVYLQPKYDLRTRKVVGAEALARWKKGDGDIIAPNDFIPIFERNGFIVEFDFYIFEKICALQKKWATTRGKVVPLAVNFSRLHINDPTFISHLKKLVETYSVDPKLLEIEMTESAFVESGDQLLTIIDELKQLGFILSMDDFGTGYSSLNLLRQVPFDILKLDKSFLMTQQVTTKEKIMISSIIRMAKELKIKVIAEGIETSEQEDFLADLSCDMGQGYYFSRPIPIEAFEKMVWEE